MDINLYPAFKFDFYGKEIVVYQAKDDRKYYSPVNPICDALGVDRRGQLHRIQRDEAISDKLRLFEMDTPPKSYEVSKSIPAKFGISDRCHNRCVRRPVLYFTRDNQGDVASFYGGRSVDTAIVDHRCGDPSQKVRGLGEICRVGEHRIFSVKEYNGPTSTEDLWPR